jgi:hypothetical protein
MKPHSYFIIILGIVLLAFAARDEQRGIASVVPPERYGRRIIISKADDPKQFRNIMIYQWLRDGLVLGAGLVLYRMCRRADRLDPFSPDFAGNAELDDLGKTLDEEEKKRHTPLR